MRTLLLLPCFFLSPDDPGAGGKTDPPPKTDPPKADDSAKELAELRQKLAERDAADKKRQEEELAKKGEHEKLANQYKAEAEAHKAELEKFQKAEKARQEEAKADLAEELKGLPKEQAELLPAGTPSEQLAWLRKARKAGLIGGGDKPAGTPAAGSKTPVKPEEIPEAAKAEWVRYGKNLGITLESYYANTWKPLNDKKEQKKKNG
jgi:seryl-tRNA synthetase